MIIAAAFALVALLVSGGFLAAAARRRSVHRVLVDRITHPRPRYHGTRHVFVSIVDHFEPFWHNRDVSLARERVQRWVERYPAIAERFRDRGGRPPRHAFFYPEEEYPLDPTCMGALAGLCHRGLGEVEVHLHHDGDTAQAMRERLLGFTHALHATHGLLHEAPDGRPLYAFIHGNWVLGNSGPNGKDCGVDDEFVVLHETGCYADFTFPSAPHPSQPPVLNRIYYPAGDPCRPRAHFTARDARFASGVQEGVLMVPGPLGLNWRRRRLGVFPALENGDLTGINPPGPDRTDVWVNTAISVAGFPRWVFVKVYTHGAQERNAARLLGEEHGLSALFADLKARYDDGERYVLHFSTPWEMWQAVQALETGDRATIDAIERFEFSRQTTG